ncbi:MAG: ABC transporter ATP-binding protein [Chitinophagales bacterium]|nr:ABC transporter ATP-binding protein [Chitinophagales bacterium]
MENIVLKVENLSKLYRLGQIGTGTISHDLNRWWAKIRGKEDPSLQIGQVNDRNKKAESDFVWSLKEIDFEVEKGEVLGIIGKNGAGKSTLLKIISQITSPTTGSIKAKGRIASLLEVGTGMHPEMTARENIYLNGAILGMQKKEISAKFEEIIDFSGCTMYVDTPIKRFSSGMRVRLGFAVAAFLEPEILIVDEVLAVGDAEFQNKAIGKMQDISKDNGRTVLFVSHNMGSIKQLCNRCILLKDGYVKKIGEPDETIEEYLKLNINTVNLNERLKSFEFKKIKIIDILFFNISSPNNNISTFDTIAIEIKYKTLEYIQHPAFVISIKDKYLNELTRISTMPISGYNINDLGKGGSITLQIENIPFTKGIYHVDVGFVMERVEWYFNLESILTFRVENSTPYPSKYEIDNSKGLICINHHWKLETK